MLAPVIRNYLVLCLSGTPDVVERLLKDLPVDDPRWDLRPDPARFTLREVVAHLADWEPIHLERLTRILEEDNPMLPDIDESKMAVENDYAHSDPRASLEWLRGGRLKVTKLLSTLLPGDWTREGHREKIGPVTVDSLIAFIAAHDGYHTHQISSWLNLSETAQ